ncbi:MAG: ABC transporter permease [Burkholderiales bacterium]|nr:ABC transporter permease [Burkholderiales bacterium]
MTLRVRPLALYGSVFVLLLYAPIALIVGYSFNANVVNMMLWEGFTFDWYRAILGLPTTLGRAANHVDTTTSLRAAVVNSAVVAIAATVVSTLVGTAAALALGRAPFRGRRAWQGLLVLPMVMPDIVLGIALLVFFTTVGLPLGRGSIVVGHCVFLSSYVWVIVSARLAGLSTDLEQASADLGAAPFTTFRRVTLPLLAFIISLDDLVITWFIAGVDATTLPMFIYGALRRGIKPEINAMATLLLGFSFVVAATGLWLRGRRL